MSNMYSEAQQDAILEAVEQIEAIEIDIEVLNGSKADCYQELKNVSVDPSHVKLLVAENRRYRRNREKAEQQDIAVAALQGAVEAAKARRAAKLKPTEERAVKALKTQPGAIVAETAPTRAQAQVREDLPRDAETGEIIEPEAPPLDVQTAVSPEAIDEVLAVSPLPVSALDLNDAGEIPAFLRRARA